MTTIRHTLGMIMSAALAIPGIHDPSAAPQAGAPSHQFMILFPPGHSQVPLAGRLLLLVSSDTSAEPRFQIGEGAATQLAFAIDVEGWRAGSETALDANAFGYPLRSIALIPRGRYRVQALLNRYEEFHRADGRVLLLPPDRGEGQQWNRKPGNLYSSPLDIALDPAAPTTVRITLDRQIPPIPEPPETKFVKHMKVRSTLLSKFWGRPVDLGAHILLPNAFEDHPEARYPLVVFHGHFPATISGFRELPPDTLVKPVYSERFKLPAYNRVEQEYAYQLFKDWTSPGFPRVLVVEIQHPTPYYDDSYSVNSENNGPYGEAIQHELIPAIEKKFRGIGQGWARFTYGGSTGGWEAMAAQVFYPEEYNGAWIACPDPIDFRQYTVVNIYEDKNAYYSESTWKRTPRPGTRNYLGHVLTTLEESNHYELVLGTRGRSGEQWDIWQAVFSPAGADGYPRPIWDKLTGVIDRDVAAYWREHYDLSYILKRDWKTLGPLLRGKLHIYVGDMDNFYLNNAVYLVEEFLNKVEDPPAEAEFGYGDRAEHCWNGDPARPNAYSRLRYHQMFIPRIMDRIRRNAPSDADTSSWRY